MGFERAKIIGLGQCTVSSCRTSVENEPPWPERPMSAVGLTALTTSRSDLSSSFISVRAYGI